MKTVNGSKEAVMISDERLRSAWFVVDRLEFTTQLKRELHDLRYCNLAFLSYSILLCDMKKHKIAHGQVNTVGSEYVLANNWEDTNASR